jgi:glycosidase
MPEPTRTKMVEIHPTAYPRSLLRPHWQETASGMVRPYLKAHGHTLRDLIFDLEVYQALGIDTIEVFAPLHGGVCYNGLDTLDFFTIDPAIGTLDDFTHLIDEAHTRQMAVVMFINLGYGHERFPAFLQACDDVREGKDTPVSHWFCWSDTGTDTMDRNLAPYFMNDMDGNWRWSDRANKYFWVKWEGENGGYYLPQFNYGDPGWQAEVQRILRYWLATGIDGMVIDAVNWYVNCNWEICRATMTGPIRAADNQFCQPEGAGGFHDDPVPWVEQGGWNCIMDYKVKLWWENVDVIGDAIRSGDPRPLEAALRSYRDRVVAAGGVCYIDPPNLETLPVEMRLLGAALTASIGEILILIGDQTIPEPVEYREGLTALLQLRKRCPTLCASGSRRQLPTSDDARFYAFLRGSMNGQALAVFNFQPEAHPVIIDLSKSGITIPQVPINLTTGTAYSKPIESTSYSVTLPAYGYVFLGCR